MRIFSSTRRKLIASVLVAGIALVPVFGFHAKADWGPARTSFTTANPPSYVTFNSITDTPGYGDERPFFDMRDANSATYSDSINVSDNEELVLRVYYDNDANPNLNLVATNTRVRFLLPNSAATADTGYAYISADNANPSVVGDTVDFSGSLPFTLAYEPGSAQIWNNVLRGTQLSDSIVTSSGALVGYNQLDGNIQGCDTYSGYVTIKVKVHMPKPVVTFACSGMDVAEVDRTHFNFTAHATTQNANVTSYTFTAKDSNGNVVDTKTVNTSATSAPYAFSQSNAGTYTVSAVVNTDQGSTNAADCTKQVTIQPLAQVSFSCTGIDATQVSRTDFNLTAHGTAQNATITGYVFTVKDSKGNVVDTKTVNTSATSAPYAFSQSNAGTYTVTVDVLTDHGSTAGTTCSCSKTIVVKPQKVTPVFACTGLDAVQIDRTHYDLTANASVQNANVLGYVFVTTDSHGRVVDTKQVRTSALSAVYHFNQTNAGTYTVSAVVNTDHGSTKLSDCTKQINVQPKAPNPVFACSALNVNTGSNRTITAKVTAQAANGAALQSVNYDFGDGVTLMTDQTSVNHTYAKDGTYVIAATLTFNVGQTTKTARCTQSVTISTPTTPQVLAATTTLPNTGPGDDVAGLFAGASALGAAGHYIVARRNRR